MLNMDEDHKHICFSGWSGVSRGSTARSLKREAKPSPGGFAGSRRLSCFANPWKNIAHASQMPFSRNSKTLCRWSFNNISTKLITVELIMFEYILDKILPLCWTANVCRRWQSDAFHLVEGISHPDEFSRDKMFWAKRPGSLRIGTILLFMPVSDVSDVSIGVWCDYFTFWEREHQSLIAGCVLLRDPWSECLSGLRRISPIFGPIQMSKEPAMNNL